MKKLISILFALMLLIPMSGCSFTTQILGDEQINPLVEIAARRIGQYVARHENKIDTINNYCNAILSENTPDVSAQSLTLTGLQYLTKNFNDPLLADDIVSLMEYFGVGINDEAMDLDLGQMRTLKAAVKAFQQGLNYKK